jgi:hypothetical protein
MWGAGAALRCAAEGLRCAARAEAVGAPLHLSPIVLVHEPPTADVCQWLVSCECLMFLVVADVAYVADVAEVGLGTWPGRRLEYSSTRVIECSLLSIPFFFKSIPKKKGITLIHFYKRKINVKVCKLLYWKNIIDKKYYLYRHKVHDVHCIGFRFFKLFLSCHVPASYRKSLGYSAQDYLI